MKGKYPKIIRTNNPVVINTGNAAPRTSGHRRLSQEEQLVVDEYVKKLISADVVEPCNSPWSSPILLVPKKDGGLRAVADLRRVNEVVIADSYTMPDIQELLDQLVNRSGLPLLTSARRFGNCHSTPPLEGHANGIQKCLGVFPARNRRGSERA
jgi:hypothetical protein